MSRPVNTNRWAGSFDCSVCRRKRLMAEEFSKKALERHRRDGGPLKCKKCVREAEEAERTAAAVRREQKQNKLLGDSSDANNNNNNKLEEKRLCAGVCQKTLEASEFNRNQWSKGEGKSKCRACVEKAIAAEQRHQKQSKEDAIKIAREEVESAKKMTGPGASVALVKAESRLAALEAEKVTGLKPVRMSSGSGRGGGRGRRSYSGRGGRGRR